MSKGDGHGNAQDSPYTVHVLHEGYSKMVTESLMQANCTCTLIKGRQHIIVDSMTPWDKDFIIAALKKHDVGVDDVTYVVSTHGHSDQTGNNNLFLRATHVVGFSISHRDSYTVHPFDEGEPYNIDNDISIIATPGHTHDDVSVIVKTKDLGTVVIAGDLFEREEDLENPDLWRTVAGSQCPEKQEQNRKRILGLADYIIPGHGPMFKVTPAMKNKS